MADCYDLKQQIKAFIRQGKLQKFINKERTILPPQEQAPQWDNERPRPALGEIKMIVGGTVTTGSSKRARKTYLKMVQNVQMTGVIPKMPQVNNPIIGLSEEDAWRLHHLHDDALVISIRVGDYNTYQVLIDNGSFADILYYLAFQQMQIDRECLVPINAPLVGFGGTKVYTLGMVTLPGAWLHCL